MNTRDTIIATPSRRANKSNVATRGVGMLLAVIGLSLGSLTLVGCNAAQAGAGIGAGAGAAAGAGIDHRNRGRGALIGAGVGAVTGYIVGNEVDKSNQRRSTQDW